MPKSRHRKNRKQRPGSRPTSSAARRHNGYEQSCPSDRIIAEFGEEGAEWIVGEYERPLTLADLELEKAIRAGRFLMDHPDGPITYTVTEVSETIWMLPKVLYELAVQAGDLTGNEPEFAGLANDEPLNHADEGPRVVREGHWCGALFLNHRGMWDFGDAR